MTKQLWQNGYYSFLKPLETFKLICNYTKNQLTYLSSTSYPLKNIAKERDITFEMQLMQTQWIMDKVSFVQLLKTLTPAGSVIKLKNV